MKKSIALIILISIMLSACGESAVYSESFMAMDTLISLKVYDYNLTEDAEALIKRLDTLFNVNDTESDISRINSEHTAEVSKHTLDVLELSARFSSLTDGAFDITVFPLVLAWGFTTGKNRVPSENELTALKKNIGYDKVKISGNTVSVPENTKIDLGAIAKGYATDEVCTLMRQKGVKSAIISLGGNVYAIGTKPDGSRWEVAVTDPQNPDGYIGTLLVEDTAIVTSATYQRFFEENGKKYHHIIDTVTGKPAESGLLSVTVLCASAAQADALSTAFFVMGMDKATDIIEKTDGVEALFVTAAGETVLTSGIKDCFKPLN